MHEELGSFTFIEYTRDGATVTARLPEPGYYVLDVFAAAAGPNESSMPQVADFLRLADRGRADCKPFPRAFKLAYEQRAQLLQPVVGRVPPGQSTLYRVKAPAFGKMKIADQMMEMKNDGVWEAEVTPPQGQSDVTIFGAVDKNASSLGGLYQFTVR